MCPGDTIICGKHAFKHDKPIDMLFQTLLLYLVALAAQIFIILRRLWSGPSSNACGVYAIHMIGVNKLRATCSKTTASLVFLSPNLTWYVL